MNNEQEQTKIETVNFLVLKLDGKTICVRISEIYKLHVIDDKVSYSAVYEDKEDAYYHTEHAKKLSEWDNKLCAITFFIAQNKENEFTKKYITKDTGRIITKVIFRNGVLNPDLESKIENDNFLDYKDGALFLKDITN